MMVYMVLVLVLARCVCCGRPSLEVVVMKRGSASSLLSERSALHFLKLRRDDSFALHRRIAAEALAQSSCQQQQREPHMGEEEDAVVDAAEHPHDAHDRTPSDHNRPHRRPDPMCKLHESGDDEEEKELNTEKRLVPEGPNPLHN